MARVVFYEKPGCIANRRQKALLRRSGHALELRNLLERALTVDEESGLLDADVILKVLPDRDPDAGPIAPLRPVRPLASTLAEAEGRAIQEALAAAQGNRSRAARMLGISRSVLYEKMARMSG